MTLLTNDLLVRARGGDGDAFRELTEPYRRELQVHCYRMLGSFQDAEDVLQDTLLSAWQGLSGYEERASLRTWLYRIATNRCLNARRAADRRPAASWTFGEYQPPEPTRLGEVVWLEPYPDTHLTVPGPDARLEQTESMALAFITALQTLPPRQVAVLILRDVLAFPAADVATMLDATVESVNSALKRARSSLSRREPAEPAEPAPGSPEESALVARFVAAYEAADLDTVIALLTDDVFMSMPPIPLEYVGRGPVAAFCASLFSSGRRFRLIPTRANLRPAFGSYVIGPDGLAHAAGLLTLTLAADGIRALTRFDTSVMASFGLPRSIEVGRPTAG